MGWSIRLLVNFLAVATIGLTTANAVENSQVSIKVITPSTNERPFLDYYHRAVIRMQDSALRNWPMAHGRKIIGKVTVSVPIFRDGSIYMAQGGPRIEFSSGNKEIDRVALLIIKQTAPYEAFNASMKAFGDPDVLLIFTTFSFASPKLDASSNRKFSSEFETP